MDCIPPNSRRVGYIVSIHGPLDEPLYMGSIYTNTNCCDASTAKSCMIGRWRIAYVHSQCKIVKIT